jgi:hypothetical protein
MWKQWQERCVVFTTQDWTNISSRRGQNIQAGTWRAVVCLIWCWPENFVMSLSKLSGATHFFPPLPLPNYVCINQSDFKKEWKKKAPTALRRYVVRVSLPASSIVRREKKTWTLWNFGCACYLSPCWRRLRSFFLSLSKRLWSGFDLRCHRSLRELTRRSSRL